jgi:hypothetical protein
MKAGFLASVRPSRPRAVGCFRKPSRIMVEELGRQEQVLNPSAWGEAACRERPQGVVFFAMPPAKSAQTTLPRCLSSSRKG